jgi:hypothetical protein
MLCVLLVWHALLVDPCGTIAVYVGNRAALPFRPGLESVVLRNNGLVTDAAIHAIVQSAGASLKELVLSGARQVCKRNLDSQVCAWRVRAHVSFKFRV